MLEGSSTNFLEDSKMSEETLSQKIFIIKKNQPTQFANLKKEYFVNLAAFPSEFMTEDDTLLSYNGLG